ncbi:hypothetical protein EDB83DRAFT_55709 [Lactarius deliciosus]|nr:hypothetical protein EDB83DRAFT_55709 [Lactarius deliciosus]
MSTRFLVPALILGMILTGACNSLWSKYQDRQCVENYDDPDSRRHVLYEQLVWILQMFLGEMLCFLPVLYEYLSKRWRAASIRLPEEDSDSTLAELSESQKLQPKKLTGRRILLLWLPALCDLTGTTLMNVGLLYTPVSIYQMTRGALVLFVGILSVLFLRRKHQRFFSRLQWFSCQRYPPLDCSVFRQHVRSDDTYRFAGKRDRRTLRQPRCPFHYVCTNLHQFVVEEKILGQYSIPPLLAVGLFGTISVLFLMPLLSLVELPPSSPAAAWFDLVRGWHQLVSTPSVLFIACSIALFNFFGLSVTKYVSATARKLDGYVQDPCNLDRQLDIGMGDSDANLTPAGRRLRPVGLWHGAWLATIPHPTNKLGFDSVLVQQPSRTTRPSKRAILVTDAGVGDEDTPFLSATDTLDETARLPADLGTTVIHGSMEHRGQWTK